MKKMNDKWLPASDPRAPRCSLDSVNDSVYPTRVISYNNGQLKYISIANDCTLGYVIDESQVYILMKEIDGSWITMQDDFPEAPIMAFKLIDCKWQRMKKDSMGKWIVCQKQFVLPVLHIDVVGNQNQPPAEISISKDGKEFKMNFNIFSNEGFVQKNDVWILMKPCAGGWSKYPGIFGSYGYKVVDGKLIVMKQNKEGGCIVFLPLINPVSYKETEDWPEVERPPIIFYLHHISLLIKADEPTCPYGFVKNKDVWVIVRKHDGIWDFEKVSYKYIAYKLIKNRWVTMRLNNMNDWIPTFNPFRTPCTHFDVLGKFEERPPLRIVLNDHSMWTAVLKPTKLGFSKNDNMWVVLEKNNDVWNIYDDNKGQIAYKIVGGQWRRFTRAVHGAWKMCTKPIPPVLSFEFASEYKYAPPSSLCFENLSTDNCLKPINIDHRSGKGFILDNGAWVLMEISKQGEWKKLNRFPWLGNNFAYILENDIWRIAMKDLDGSWKCGSFKKNRQFVYDHLPRIPVKKPIYHKRNSPLEQKPPKMFIIYIGGMPKLVSSTSVKLTFNFHNYKGAWVLIERFDENKFWRVAGGIIAFKLINSRWVSMKMQGNEWIPSYNPNTTPVTHFESADPFRDSRPPLRIVINDNGKESWKVIFQNSGYGFIKQDDMWVLMRKRCDGTWENHTDDLLECTGYKMIDKRWTRFKKREFDDWIRMDSSLPVLKCDFSVLSLDRSPPPSFNKTFLLEPRKTQQLSVDTFLHLYSEFGFRQDNGHWILMHCDGDGKWSEYKILPEETDLFGYKCCDGSWNLLKKNKSGQWVEGEFENIVGDRYKFIMKEKTHTADLKVVKIYEHKNRDEQIVENKNKRDKNQDEPAVKYETQLEAEDENKEVLEIKQIKGTKDEYKETFMEKNKHETIEKEVNDENKESVEDEREQKVKEKEPCEDENKPEVNNDSKEIFEEVHKQNVNSANNEPSEDEHKIAIGNGNELQIKEEDKGIVKDNYGQGVTDQNEEPKEENEIEIKDNSELQFKVEDEDTFLGETIQNFENKNKVENLPCQETIEVKNVQKIEDINDSNEKTIEDQNKRILEIGIKANYDSMEKVENKATQAVQPFKNKNKEEILPCEETFDAKNHQKIEEVNNQSEKTVEGQNERKLDILSMQEVNDGSMETVEYKAEREVIFEGKSRVEVKNRLENKGTVEDKSGCGFRASIQRNQEVAEKNEEMCKETTNQQDGDRKEKEYRGHISCGKFVPTDNSWKIPLTNPVKYHQLVDYPTEEKPPGNVCLKVRGSHKRISLVSKMSKIGFQYHNGVWVLLERFSGFWKILHNSAGFPLAYKLIDNRWVSMRMNKNGSWIPTFNPVTTPRTYFDSEGPEDTKPPRRIIFTENCVSKWKEISEYSGFGFVKNEDMWILMSNINNRWTEYRSSDQEMCAFKIQDFKWTKFAKGTEASWKNIVEDLPVLHYDFAANFEGAPPELTPYLQKIAKIDPTNVGFQLDNGAWILMQHDENNGWTSVLGPKTTHGFVRAKGDLWNVVRKDNYGQWTLVETNRNFQSAFEDLFRVGINKETETGESSEKNILTRSIDPSRSLAGSEHNCSKVSDHININKGGTSSQTVQIEKIATQTGGVISDHSTQSNTPVSLVSSAFAGTSQTVSCENISESPKQSYEQGCQRVEGIGEKIGDHEQKMRKDPEMLENQVKLNPVELYLASKPDCCLGCPTLQNLLREFRPSNMPNKIIRKVFRLPNGSMRMLSIPKALSDSTKSTETQRKITTKRRKLDTRILDCDQNSSNKKMKYND